MSCAIARRKHTGGRLSALIFHVCRKDEWEAARASGRTSAVDEGAVYQGSSQDVADGFIHFSTAEQVVESVSKHRAGQSGLVLLAVDPALLGERLKWEPSRRGQLFPHVYGGLPVTAVRWARDLPLGADGRHSFPPLD